MITALKRRLMPSRFDTMSAALLLSVLLLLVIVAYPLSWLLLAAFGLPGPISLDGIIRAYGRSQNITPLVNTIILAAGTALASLMLGVPLAWATARTNMPFKKTIRACVALSYITPPYLTALAFIILAGPQAGYINRLSRYAFGPDAPTVNVFGMTGIILVISLHVFAFTYFLTEAALRSVDASYEDAAQMLGASRLTSTLKINLPLVAPAITGGALLAAVESLALFGPQAFLGLPAQITFLPTRIYGVITSYPPRWSEASALSVMLVLLTCAGLYTQRWYLKKRSYITVGGKSSEQREVDLGAWRWGLFAFSFVVVFFSAIAPLAVLGAASVSKSWVVPLTAENLTLAHYTEALFEDPSIVRGIKNSFFLASAAALTAVAIGALIAYIDQRTTIKGRKALDYLALLPLGLPGPVMAVGLLLAFIYPPLVLFGTIWILYVAYIARFIPLATRSLNGAIQQVDPSLEEAARITGATKIQAFSRILLPILRPALIVAFLLIFVPAFAELSATILLYSNGTETISVAIYKLNEMGKLEVMAALSMFTIFVVLLVTAVMKFFDRSAAAPASE